MEEQRPVMPLEIMKFVSPARALHRAQTALHDAAVLLSVYHSPDLEEVKIVAQAEESVKALALLWASFARNALTRAEEALADEVTVPPTPEGLGQ